MAEGTVGGHTVPVSAQLYSNGALHLHNLPRGVFDQLPGSAEREIKSDPVFWVKYWEIGELHFTLYTDESRTERSSVYRQALDRQDAVDNAIFALLQELIGAGNIPDYDGEQVGIVRDAIAQVAEHYGVNEAEFYPYIEEAWSGDTGQDDETVCLSDREPVVAPV